MILFQNAPQISAAMTPTVALEPERALHSHLDPHGKREDHYHWLRDPNWPQVTDRKIIAYLEAENHYAESQIPQSSEDFLFEEMKARIKQEDSTVPCLDGQYYYYSYIKNAQQYYTFARKASSQRTNTEEIILDQNVLAEGHEYLHVACIRVSPDHKFVAYLADFSGDERYTLYVKRIADGVIIDQSVSNAMGEAVWDENGKGLFYIPAGEIWRSDKICYHEIGTQATQDKLIYHEKDPVFHVSIEKSASRKYIMFGSTSSTTSEYRFIESNNPTQEPEIIAQRTEGLLYDLEHHGDYFYIRTNLEAPNFKVMRVKVSDVSKKQWESYIEPSEEYVEALYAYRNHLALVCKKKGLNVIKVIDVSTKNAHEITFADQAYQASVIYTTFDAQALRYSYSSPRTPATVFEYSFASGASSALKTQEIPSGFDQSRYTLKRLWAVARDGVEIPVTVIYDHAKVQLDGSAPLYLYGYGSYGVAIPDSFSAQAFSLIDRGFVHAVAHIRGGSELGKTWHESAKFLTKKKTFEDFIDATEYLIAQGYSSAKNVVIHGGSAGGLLIGACINMRSDLYHAAIAEVPFVDVLTTMLDESLPLTQYEFKEWGNPQQEEYYNYIKSYSPYDNVVAKEYPHLMVTAGLTDPRVSYWEPAKWVALLRNLKTDNNLLLFKTEMHAGHGGLSGRFDSLKRLATAYMFILKVFEKNL